VRPTRSSGLPERVTLALRVTPGAKQERLSLDASGTLRVAVRERAVDGAANDAVCRALATWLGVSPSAVTIRRGAASRRKVVAVAEIAPADLAARLAALGASP
jgi:uncharacterized protein YggU (UPF0235/DUF167 family)